MQRGEEDIAVTISQEAAAFIVAEAQSWHPKETGGVLVGHFEGDRLNIQHAVGPGPRATHKRAFFQRDQEHSERQVEMIHKQSGGKSDYLGEWHSHSRRQGPSATDISSMLNIRDEASNNCRQPLLVIVMQHRGSWGFSAFVPDGIGLKNLQVEIK